MTNTLYFSNTIRDDESVSSEATEEESPVTYPRHTHYHHHQGVVVASSEPINDWISPILDLNPEDENKDVCGSNENFSSTTITRTSWSAGGKLEYSILKSFSFKELKSATRKFHHDSLLGEGSFGRVFKGFINVNKLTATKPGKGITVAVRRFSQHPSQGHSELWSELKYLGRLCHPNLVRLFGYCSDNEQHLLVYDFVPRGSLEHHLFKRSSSLSWNVRMKIALGAAKGLAFLHSAAVNAIHRNFTSSNILLDLDYNAKLTGLGLPVDVPTDVYNAPTMLDLSSSVARASGFLSPEYSFTGQLTAKSDVYSFGAVLMELLSGRRAIDMRLYLFPRANRYLCGNANPYRCSKYDIFCFLDSHLAGQYSLEKALKAAHLALQCLAENAECRPDIDDVVATLEELQVCEAG